VVKQSGGGFLRHFLGGTALITVGFFLCYTGKVQTGDPQVAFIVVGMLLVIGGVFYMFS
jgi:hypothetical protein